MNKTIEDADSQKITGMIHGAIAGVPYNIVWSTRDGFLSYLALFMDYAIMPAVRQTQKSKNVNERAIKYNGQQAAVRDRLVLIMREHGIPEFAPKQKLRMKLKVVRHTVRGDVDNYCKAVMDACQGALYPNDKPVRSITVDIESGMPERFEARFEVIE